MTRLENIKQAGFFPLPAELSTIIASYIIPSPDGGRIIDPAAGKGVALVELAQLLNLDPYGVEINEERAAAAKQHVHHYLGQRDNQLPLRTHILQGTFKALRTTPGAYSVNYNNPPYMFADDKEDGRTEYQFLRDTRHYLQTDGLLIWVVPQHMLMHKKAPEYLYSWYDNLTIRRFPDELYSDFRQVVVFGVKRPYSVIPDREAINAIKDLGRLGRQVEPLRLQTQPIYSLPKPVEPENFRFRALFVDPQDGMDEAKRNGVVTTRAFQDLFASHIESKFNPLTPMKIGHLVGIIAAGHLNNQVLEKDGERILLKGHSFKMQKKEETREAAGDEGQYKVRTTFTDTVITNITYLTPEGELMTLKGDELGTFMGNWIEPLTQTVTQTYQPRYQFDLNGFDSTLRRLNLKRTLPFYGKPGLLPAQMHGAAAMATQLKENKSAILVGTMGTGKTVMATAVAAVLHNHVRKTSHTIVLCPPHLVNKWIREIKVTWPKAKAMALKSISDVDRFFADEGPIFGVMKETTARSGSGWAHTYWRMGATASKPRSAKDKLTYYKRSQLAEQIETHPIAEDDPRYLRKLHARHRRGILRCPTCGHAVVVKGKEGADVPAAPHNFRRAKMVCGQCHSPLYQDDRRRTKGAILHGFKKYARREARIRKGHKLIASNGNNGYAKYPLASYIFRKYKKRTHLLIADECHQYKGADSDRGYAFHRLICASQRVLALTGTIYGGKASSLFDLMYRLSPEVQRAFTDESKTERRRMMRTKWVDSYGILQEVQTTSFDKHGKQSGNSKERTQLKELPGASPTMLPWILNRSIFINLENMGVALPPYEEIPMGIPMTAEMQNRYDRFRDVLTELLRDRLLRNDKSLLGAYLQALLTWPDSPWRNKQVAEPNDPDKILAKISGIDAMPPGTAPKERAIIDLIQEEKAAGRKVLLLCQQTSTLDITPQWEEMLEKHGLKTAVLRSTPPDKREAWIKKQVEAGVDVVITHPKKVETGLDLLDLPTEIWMGIEYSIYTVLQASRRGWRLGQDKPVKVYFFAYENTLQTQALRLIAAKVGAALRVNGDTIPDDSLAELDELAQTDMVNALTEILLQEADYEAEMKELNAAYEAAKNGHLTYSDKYNFADTNGQRQKIRKKWATWAKQLHPDKHMQEEGEAKLDNLQTAFQNATTCHNEEESFMGEFSMDVEEEPIEVFEPEPEVVEVTEPSAPAEPVRLNPYGYEAIRKAKQLENRKFIVNIPSEEMLDEVLTLAKAMVATMNGFRDPGTARDELMTYQFGKQKQFNTAVLMRMHADGYSEAEVTTLLEKYRATALAMTDWILAKEEAAYDLDGILFEDRADELQVLGTAVWHEAHVQVPPEPEPMPVKPVMKRLAFGITDPNAFRPQRKAKKAPQAQMSLFG